MSINSKSESYAAAGVDITAGYKAVELMKKHILRTKNEGCLDDVGGFGGCFGLNLEGIKNPVLAILKKMESMVKWDFLILTFLQHL